MSHQECNEYKIKLYGKRTSEEFRNQTLKIIEDLSLFGRSISTQKRQNSNRALSKRFTKAVRDDVVIFAWNPHNRRSVAVLKPGYQLERISNNYVRIKRR